MSVLRLLRLLLLPLSLLLAVSVLSQPAAAVDGVYRGWQISDAAVDPYSDSVYLLDLPNHIRVVNRTSGQPSQRQAVELQLGELEAVSAIGLDPNNRRLFVLVKRSQSADWRDSSVQYEVR